MPAKEFTTIPIEEPLDEERKATFIYHSHKIEKINYTYEETLEILKTGRLAEKPKENIANVETITIDEDFVSYQEIEPRIMAATLVKNHAKALDYSLSEEFAKAPLQKAARKIHRILFNGDRSWHHTMPPGQYRVSGVSVGKGEYARSCPHHLFIPYLMERWGRREQEVQKTDEGLLRMHAEFELIHPFPDGNGRAGRVIWAGLSKKYGLPISIVDSSKKNKKEYYKSIMSHHDKEYEQEYYLKKKDSLDKKTLEMLAKMFVLGGK